MKTPEEIKRWLSKRYEDECAPCAFSEVCVTADWFFDVACDALAYIQQLEQEKFDVLDEISSAYYGKMMYGLNDDGTVYSRYSCDNMTFEQAVAELAGLLYREVE